MSEFDWHSTTICRDTPVSASYKNTQNVRRFLKSQCGENFKFDRPFMRWIIDGKDKNMGDVADEWLKRRAKAKPEQMGSVANVALRRCQ